MKMDYVVYEPDDEHIARIIVRFLQERGYSAGYQLGYPNNKIFIKVDTKEEANRISIMIRRFMEEFKLTGNEVTIDELKKSVIVPKVVLTEAEVATNLAVQPEFEIEEPENEEVDLMPELELEPDESEEVPIFESEPEPENEEIEATAAIPELEPEPEKPESEPIHEFEQDFEPEETEKEPIHEFEQEPEPEELELETTLEIETEPEKPEPEPIDKFEQESEPEETEKPEPKQKPDTKNKAQSQFSL
jgi:hypothetical protein